MFEMYSDELHCDEIAAIDRIKLWVDRLLEERANIPEATAGPSTYWKYSVEIADYMLRIETRDYAKLRLHTYHIDGGCIVDEIGYPEERYRPRYTALQKGLPEKYWIGAPLKCGEAGHIIDGRLVNGRIVNWQGAVRNLWHCGLLPILEKTEAPTIIEIGGGYGGFANHILNMFPNALYVIVDLPETLLFSASYLTMVHGPDRVTLLEDSQPVSSDRVANGGFLMVPNFYLSALAPLKFDLAVNMYSFAEMTEAQAEGYLKFLAPRTDQLYSKNYEIFDASPDRFSLTPLLQRYFNLRVIDIWEPGPPPNSSLKQSLKSRAGRLRRAMRSVARRSHEVMSGDGYIGTPLADTLT